MNDLIWIGNTLYPRWVVLGFAAVAVIAAAALLSLLARNAEQKR